MQNLLRSGQAFLADRMSENVSDDVYYRRQVGQDTYTVLVRAGRGATEHEIEEFEGMKVTGRTEDFLIRPADLVLPTIGLTKPERGDWIEPLDDVGGVTGEVFVVTTPFGKNCFELKDHDSRLRIYTERTK